MTWKFEEKQQQTTWNFLVKILIQKEKNSQQKYELRKKANYKEIYRKKY